MTATPRIYGETAKKKELDNQVSLASMDDEDIYGPTFVHRSFGWAVENNLLTDFKVLFSCRRTSCIRSCTEFFKRWR